MIGLDRQRGFLLNPFRFGGGGGGGSSYYEEVMADNPVVYWRLGEASGTSAFDSSGNNKTALYREPAETVSCPGLITSDVDTAIDLPGTATSSQVGLYYAGNTVVFSSSWSIDMLLRPDSAPALTGVGIIAQMGIPVGTNYPEIDVYDRGGGSYSIRVMNSGVSQLILTTDTWTYGNPMHLCIRQVGGGALEVYVDGVIRGSTSWNYAGNAGEVRVGCGAFNGTSDSYPYAGVIDEVAMYPSALSPSRIAAHAAARTA